MLNSYLHYLYIFKYTDLIEILIFATAFYAFSVWLRCDKQKNLLAPFYLVNILLIATNLCNMETIHSFLIHSFPAFIMLFILVHQSTLQRNFIALKNLSPVKNKDGNWFQDFMRTCLNAINNNREILVIVEGKDALSEFVNCSFAIRTEINHALLNALLNSPSFDSNKLVWVSHQGILNGINADLKTDNDLLWAEDKDIDIEKWKQEAILFTSKMDTLIFKTNLSKRSFDIVVQGKLLDNIAPNNAINIIDQFIKKINLKTISEGKNYENITKNHNQQQPLS